MEARRLVQALRELIGAENVLDSAAARRTYDCDAYTVVRALPDAVAFPRSTEDAAKLVGWCCLHSVPVTPRGAGTSLSGGATPLHGGVVVSTKRMERILEIDVRNRQAHVEAGVVNGDLSAAVAPFGLHFAPDPSSLTVATIGGNIAENSGGAHTLKLGVTAQHTLAVTLVDERGSVRTLGSRVPGGPGFDALPIVIGSEGTLGLVTEAWLKLTPLPAHSETALTAFRDVRAASDAVSEVIRLGVLPSALEMMDEVIMGPLRDAFGLWFPPGAAALLLIECDGEPEQVACEMEAIREVCVRHGASSFEAARTQTERERLWTARKKGVGALGRLAPSKVTHDVVIPPSRLAEALEVVAQVARRHRLTVANIFHAGDGNLHPCMVFDGRDAERVEAVRLAGEEIARACVALGGSVTGEHGVGIEKLDLMSLMFSPDDLRLQRDARRSLVKGQSLNPGKVLPK